MSKQTDIQIRNYLGGRMESSLLLMGRQKKKMLEDALMVASSLLRTDIPSLYVHPDFLSVTPPEGKASIGVDDIIPILNKGQLQSAVSDRQVVLVEGFDRMTVAAQNKLLKLIEEGELVLIALAAEDAVIPTVKSRMRVVVYEPLSLAEYMELKGESFSLSSYFVTGGDADAEPDSDVLGIFENVGKALCGNNKKELFTVLNQVKEKDSNNFFTLYREYVPALISYIGKLYADMGRSDMVKLCMENRNLCNQQQYTAGDFFVFVAELEERR